MAITKEKAIDILDKIDFFQGQRAGRELWNEKSRYVQELDLRAFQEDVALLREYIADIAPKSEVAREIFEEIETLLALNSLQGDVFTGKYFDADLENDIAEFKKKYTGVAE